MRRATAPALVLLLALIASGCHRQTRNDRAASPSDSGNRPGNAATQASSFTGTLRGSTVAVGGETTGWRLEGDNQTGGIDVDVSKVRQRARQLDGRRVTVTGRMATRHWPERGDTQVLVAESIDEAARKGADATPGAGR